MKQSRKTLSRTLAVVCAGALLLGVVNVDYTQSGKGTVSGAQAETQTITSLNDGLIDTQTESLFDPSVVYQLTDTVTADTEISVILRLSDDSLLDTYEDEVTDMSFSDYMATPAAMKARTQITREENKLVKKLNRSGVDYKMGETYDTLLNGFEVTIKAGDYSALAAAVPEATLIVGEEYEECETQVVTNDVDVYDTGIFDSSASKYQGDGVVVAVLDTGLDYTHSAFAVENFDRDESIPLAYTKSDVESEVSSLHAATTTADLTADDVYINEKVPYAYDYADKDTDVFPINSEHGTHVSGIITGKDDEITGVAPAAQLMMMKVFSEASSGAKTSWILAALEDCVKLGVDVINMSLGTSCGFSREVDKEETNEIYDRIEEAGISMVCAAGNDYNATYGSDKNGSLGLTSNPESSTVSSPSSYEATMSVASVSGVASNYIKYGDTIMYFNEATDSTATTRSFFDDILDRYARLYGVTVSDTESYEIPFEVIPGLGRNSDYSKDDYTGEIVLVKRGTTTFEEKIRIAMSKNALGIIIYNNVSGTISMSIGSNADAAACSISQDDGEILAAAGKGYLTISKSQQAGPFMSDFSSWGPTSDLRIKPEITAHGGDIYSCVPGGGYDRLSGTSMATPNQAGVTALIRQYVKENETKFGLKGLEGTEYNLAVTAAVNELMMSTADIIYNKNGLPYSVRKQGSGLVNLYDAQDTDAYVTTLDSSGEEMNKAKLELGDDRGKTGEYTMTIRVHNISSVSVRYRVGAIVQTEGVSTTYTSHGDTTVTQDGETLTGAETEITSVSGGTKSGDEVTVSAGGVAEVAVKVTLSEDDKDYLNESFENGMYVEGFVTLEQLDGTDAGNFVDLNVPFLAFYGDWTEAPIFDEEYYDTNADEINAGLDEGDKLMADGFATRVVGGLYDDYIAYLGVYMFTQDPSSPQVAASKDHIAMSNQSNSESYYNVNNLAYVYAGLRRNAKEIDITITEDATGKVIYTNEVYNQRKSYGTGSIYASAVDMDGFSAYDYNLKNNTQYTVTLKAYVDYGYDEETGELDKMHQDETNERNTFSFPLYIDYEAPVLTGVEFRKEYDSTTKKTSLYADLSIYDNHYAMAAQAGNVTKYTGSENYLFSLNTFGGYATPVSSSFNSTSVVTIELTDYMNEIKESAGYVLYSDGTYQIAENTNSFIVVLYDYALNQSVFEVHLPDEVVAMYFGGTYNNGKKEVDNDGDVATVTLELNETLDLTEILNVYPSTSWVQALDYESSDSTKVRISNQTVLALDYTDAPVTVTVTGYTSDGTGVEAELSVIVEGNSSRYTLPIVNSFSLTGYYTEKAFYSMSSDDREIGYEGYNYTFDSSPSLSMYPSECVDVYYNLQTYFPEYTSVEFSVANSSVASVITREDGTGVITAQAEGSTTVTATVYYKDPETGTSKSQTSARISVTVKDPFTTNSIYLMSYKGLGGTVEIPDDRGITTIYEYAFSNYEYVPKDLSAGDVIDDEDPYATKPTYIGDDTITKVIIPEGVKEIDGYAFANLTALEEVVLPSTLTRIGYGAFYNCTSLKTITYSGKDNVQFINESAFQNCTSLETFNFSSVIAIGKNAFRNCGFSTLELGKYCQSLGEGAFRNNTSLFSVSIKASSIKMDSYVFYGCSQLGSISVNASVIPSYAFYGCSSLSSVTLGADVSVINAYAFYGTNVSTFTLNSANPYLTLSTDKTMVYSDKGKTLQVAAPKISGSVTLSSSVTTISNGAFAGCSSIKSVTGDGVKYVEDYAFAGCTALNTISLSGNLAEIGAYAFYRTKITALPTFSSNTVVGDWAFASNTAITTVSISNGVTLGDYAFYGCTLLGTLTVGDGCTLGDYAFYGCTKLGSAAIGTGCTIGDYAFAEDLVPDYYTWYLAYGGDYAALYWATYSSVYTDYTDEYVLENGENASGYIFVEGYTAKFFYYDISKASTGDLKTVSIGNGTTIGTGAFMNCSKINNLTLGSYNGSGADIIIGDYAFYNCVSLNGGSLSFGNVIEIGAYAFSVMDETIDVMYPVYSATGSELTSSLMFAYEVELLGEEGTPTLTGYKYTTQRGALSGTLDLSSVTVMGEGAFARNTWITTVVLNESIQKIPAYAFYMCTDLKTVYSNGDTENDGTANLSDVGDVGEYAFAYAGFSCVTLRDDAILSDGAFYMCEMLGTAKNLESVLKIGAYAFAYTALGAVGGVLDVSGATYIGDYAFAYITTEGGKAVCIDFLGGKGTGALEDIGENPFLGSNVDFTSYETVIFGEEEKTEENDTYSVNGVVFVSEGVLYTTVIYTEDDFGYVLVTYPVEKTDADYTVYGGTVRISAHAFDDNDYLKTVTLSSELLTIGDKAFYDCDSLSVVVFTSYYAPALEEEFDESYYGLVANYPGQYVMYSYDRRNEYGIYYEGLGILDYSSWSSGPNNYFYGANFVNYIGKLDSKLTMVVPVNGQQYDSFTLAQYFDTVIYGASAATADTLSVIAMIEALPDSRYVTLADAEDVYAALDAYNALVPEQQALVSNYSKLSACIGTLSWLEYDDGGGGDAAEEETEKSSSSFMKDNMWGLIIALVILVAFVALLVYTILMKKRQSAVPEVAGAEEGPLDAPENGNVLFDSTAEETSGGDAGSEVTLDDEPSEETDGEKNE